MAFFSGKMLEIALDLSQHDEDFQDMALRFLAEYLKIATDINKTPEEAGKTSLRYDIFGNAFHIVFSCLAIQLSKTNIPLLVPGLWDPDEGFYFDRLREDKEGKSTYHILKIKSMVGLVPLFGVIELTDAIVDKCAEIKEALQSAMKHTEFVRTLFLLKFTRAYMIFDLFNLHWCPDMETEANIYQKIVKKWNIETLKLGLFPTDKCM